MVKPIIESAYLRSRTQQHTTVAYKGGCLEKNLLNELQIPCVNLEDFGCPKVEKRVGMDEGFTCGRHKKPTHHCPKQETYLFYRWMPGGVRHGPQRIMGKNITDVHYTRDTME